MDWNEANEVMQRHGLEFPLANTAAEEIAVARRLVELEWERDEAKEEQLDLREDLVALRDENAKLRAVLREAQTAVKEYIVATGRHLPGPWFEHLTEKCRLKVDAIGFVSVPDEALEVKP